MNDAARLDLCLRHETKVIACAAIHLAAKDLQFPLPGGTKHVNDDDVDECQWWRLFGVDITEVIGVSERILHLYEMPKVRRKVCC